MGARFRLCTVDLSTPSEAQINMQAQALDEGTAVDHRVQLEPPHRNPFHSRTTISAEQEAFIISAVQTINKLGPSKEL